jgi:hypothetical protein
MKHSALRVSAIAVSLCAGGAAFAAGLNHDSELRPTGKGWGQNDENAASEGRQPKGFARGAARTNAIVYHNGPVMTSGANVYYIWYGNWTGNSATTILTDLMQNFTGSPIFNTNNSYYNGAKVRVPNTVNYIQSTTDNYSLGASLSDANIETIVASAISSGRLPKDTNGVYFVLTSKDVKETSGFGSQYCGWHTNGTIGGSDIKYAFVGDASTQAPTGCIALTATQSPNGNLGADGMASVIFHELSETVTDPDLNAWYDRQGNENADKCAWTFGTTYAPSSGKIANVKLGNRDYLLQRNWVNSGSGFCSLSYP